MHCPGLKLTMPVALPALGLLAFCQSSAFARDTIDGPPPPLIDSVVPQPETSSFPLGEVVASYHSGVLSSYDAGYGTVLILRLAGSNAEMGDQYGHLVGPRIPETWNSLMAYMGEELGGLSAAAAERMLGPALDRAYEYLEPYIVPEFDEEIENIAAGTVAALSSDSYAQNDIATILKRIIALTNTSDLNAFNEGPEAFIKMLRTGTSAELDAFYQSEMAGPASRDSANTELELSGLGKSCSFFAAWGQRTQDGKLFASRNLDWVKDTGIATSALVTVYEPEGGLQAYATFGYAGLVGALAGINESGVLVSEVGSNSVLEKLKGQPWTLKFREILATSSSLEDAYPLMTNEDANQERPTTLGYNFLIADGDADGMGVDVGAAVFETNGGTMSVFRQDAGCLESKAYLTYGRDGQLKSSDTVGMSKLLNAESQAVEIDADGNARLFRVIDGEYQRDEDGYLIEDPHGETLPVGKALSCALYRGDEALGYGTRRWQTASNGPSGDDPREVLFDSGSYINRYSNMHGILDALWTGSSFSSADGVEWVETGSAQRLVSTGEAIDISRAAAMGSSVMNVVYDATDLKVWIAYESGTGSSWSRAADNNYAEIDVGMIFDWELD